MIMVIMQVLMVLPGLLDDGDGSDYFFCFLT